MLDIACIVVLGSGIYLWLARGRRTRTQPQVRRQGPPPATPAPGPAPSRLARLRRDTWSVPAVATALASVGLAAALLSDAGLVKWAGVVALALPLLALLRLRLHGSEP